MDPMTIKMKPSTAIAVFAQVESTGKHAALTAMPLHEVVLARLRVEAFGESLLVHNEWPAWSEDTRTAERLVGDEYHRLLREYGKELLVSVYGNPHEGRLQKVMMRIFEAHSQGVKPMAIVDLGKPESDFLEMPVTPIEASTIMGKDTDAARKVDSSLLIDNSPLPDGVKGLGEGEGDDETPSIDGNLVTHLTDNGWNEPQALAVARVVLEHGIRSIPDSKIMSIPGVKNAEQRKALRHNLEEYRLQTTPE